jgi:hypothetical protein
MSEENKSRRFPILYHIKHLEDGIDFDDVEEGKGVADSMLVLAIINQADDKKSVHCVSLDGHAGAPFSTGDMFSTWIAFTSILFEQLDPTDLRKGLIFEVLKNAKKLIDSIDEKSQLMQDKPLSGVVETKGSTS